MIDSTINDGKTIGGGGENMILAGYYYVLYKLGHASRF